MRDGLLEDRRMEEWVVLLNEDGSAKGRQSKEDVHHSDTPLHLAFSLFLFDNAGRLLVQRRALDKLTWPGVWSNSCCGHPLPGEAMEAAVRRRTSHELGFQLGEIECVLPRFRYSAQWDGIWENEVCPVWVGRIESTPTNYDRTEVDSVDWVEWQAFAAASRSPEKTTFAGFSPWSLLEAKLLDESDRFKALFEEWKAK